MNRRIDRWIVGVVAVLVVFGLTMVYSASAVVAAERGSPQIYLVRQAVAVGIGVLGAALVALVPTRQIRRFQGALHVAVLLALGLCLVPGLGIEVNGAHRWLGFGSVRAQPSEFAKVMVLVALAHQLSDLRRRIEDPRAFLRALAVPLPAMLLVLLEPDLGTAFVLAVLTGLLLYVAGAHPRHLVALAGGGALAFLGLAFAEPYRVRRLVSFTDPWARAQNEGYHVIQSWIAMHSGGLLGQGLGNSKAKLLFLPEPWTDFIGAVVAEELGYVAILAVLAAFAVLAWRAARVAQRARDAFGTYLAAGIGLLFAFEAFFNLGVVMGVLPPKGLVLPFVSYGASAMIAHLWAVGLLLGVAAEAADAPIGHGWPHRGEPATRAAAAVEAG